MYIKTQALTIFRYYPACFSVFLIFLKSKEAENESNEEMFEKLYIYDYNERKTSSHKTPYEQFYNICYVFLLLIFVKRKIKDAT